MLVLTRKEDQEILIGPNVKIKIFQIKGHQVRLGIEAPKNVKVIRSECLQRKSAINLDFSQTQSSQGLIKKPSKSSEVSSGSV